MKWIGQNIYDKISKFRNTVDFSKDVTFYQPVNNADPQISIGASDTERLQIFASYTGTATQTMQQAMFVTHTASGTAHDGMFTFKVDETAILDFKDAGINLRENMGIGINGTDILTDSSGTATLNNIDALDATTIATFNAALTAGDITGVTAGTGLSGGGTSGAVTLNVEAAQTGITSLGTLTALQVDNININGDTITASADLTIVATGNDISIDTDHFDITSSSSPKPILRLTTTGTTKDQSSELRFIKDALDTEDGENLGQITFYGEDEGNNLTQYSKIVGEISESDEGDEAGKLTLFVAESDSTTSTQSPGLIIEGEHATDGQVDVTIANGAASTTTVAGTLTMGSTAAITNAGLLSVAGQTNITSLGTLTNLDVDNININGDTITASGDLAIVATGNDITVDTDSFVISSATSQKPFLELKNTNSNNKSSVFQFTKDKGAAGADNDTIGVISFAGDDAAQTQTFFATIIGSVSEADNTDEAGKLALGVAASDGTSTQVIAGLVLEGEHATGGEVDVTIAAGAASTTTIAGNLTINGTIATVAGSNANLLMNSGSDIVLEADNAGGSNASSIQYLDAGGTNRLMLSANSDVVQLCNRASNGTVTIKANTSTAGSGGEVTAATFTDTETTIASDLTVNGDTVTFQSANADDPHVVIKNTHNSTDNGARLDFNKLRADDGVEQGMNLGEIWFTGQDNAQNAQDYAYIVGEIDVGTHGQESGALKLGVASHDGDLRNGLTLTGGSVNDEIDVVIGNGAASVTTVAGTLTMGSTAALTNAGLVAVAAQTNITSLGTLTALDVDNININGDTITASADLAIVATGNDITVDTDNLVIESSNTTDPTITLKTSGNAGSTLEFISDKGGGGVDGEAIGTIKFIGDDTAQVQTQFARIVGSVSESADSDEAGKLEFFVAESDGTNTNQNTIGLLIEGEHATDGQIDVTIAAGAASTTTVAGDLIVTSDLTVTGDNVTFESANADDPIVTIKNTSDDTNDMASLKFVKDRGAAPAVGTNLAEIYFVGEDSGQNEQEYGRILCEIDVATHGQESGILKLGVANHDGGNGYGLTMTGGSADNEVDTTIGLGAASVTTVAGTLTMGSTATLNNTGILQTAAQTNITSVGTLTGLTTSGAIELGHASDTTLARSASGVVTIEGNQIVTDGAVSVASGASAPVAMRVARRIITQAEMNALHTTPIEIIPAPGANKMIVINYGGNVIFADRAATNTATSTLGIGFDGFTETYSALYARRFMLNITTDTVWNLNGYTNQVATVSTDAVNKKVEAKLFGACTTNCFTALDVTISYWIIDLS